MIAEMESSRAARPGRRGFPVGPQMEDRARRARAAPDGGQHRRRRARHVQGPLLPRARSAPLPRRHADRRVGCRHRRASTSICATSTPACRAILTREIAALVADPPCALPPIQLRRGAGAYICGEESAMIESIEGKRGMPRLRPPYVAQVGPVRPAHARAQHGNAVLGARHPGEGRRTGSPDQGRNGRKGLRSFSVSGRVKKPGVHLAPAGITVRELIAEYCGGMLDGHEFYGYLPGGASGGILPASMGDIPLDFDTLQPHGCFIGSAAVDHPVAARPRARRGGEPDGVLRRRVLRAMHAVPRRHREGGRADAASRAGTSRCSPISRRRWPMRRSAVWGRRRRTRSRASSSIFRTSCSIEMNARTNAPRAETDRLQAERQGRRRRFPAKRIIEVGGPPRRRDPAPLLQARHAPRRQLPLVHGRDQGRARAGAVVLPHAGAGHGRARATAPRALHSQKMIVELLASDMPERVYKPDSELAHWKAQARHRHAALRRRAAARGRHVASGDGGQPRRLHPVHALRARMPRGAGQRRHRLRVPRRAFEHRVRPPRSDGRLDVRGLRRMRAGVPHRRARAGERRVPRPDRQDRAVGVPVLRRRLPDHLPRAATTRSCASKAATAPRTTSGCASRAASASTTSRTRIG